ncbi:MAG: hypothetical protein GX410_08825 [Elusimicrobia bacterium]|nr:hypothetical protein [Elusimicrobiota bacterium]
MKKLFLAGIIGLLGNVNIAGATPPVPSKRTFQVFSPGTYLFVPDALVPFYDNGMLDNLGYERDSYRVQSTPPTLSGEKVTFQDLIDQLKKESGILEIAATHGDDEYIAVEFFPAITDIEK